MQELDLPPTGLPVNPTLLTISFMIGRPTSKRSRSKTSPHSPRRSNAEAAEGGVNIRVCETLQTEPASIELLLECLE